MKQPRRNQSEDPAGSVPQAAAGTVEGKPGGRDQQQNTPDDNRRDAEEIGGPEGPEPTRFGDWERKGRCIDF